MSQRSSPRLQSPHTLSRSPSSPKSEEITFPSPLAVQTHLNEARRAILAASNSTTAIATTMDASQIHAHLHSALVAINDAMKQVTIFSFAAAYVSGFCGDGCCDQLHYALAHGES